MPPRPPGPRRAHDCIMEKAGNEKLPAHNIVKTGAAELCDEPLPRLFLAAVPKMACWLSGQPVKAKPDNHEKRHFLPI
jgi:hypothetical protein